MNEKLNLKLSDKGNELLEMYKSMVESGYSNDLFNLRNYRKFVKQKFEEFNINTVLDYGSGQSNWKKKDFDLESKKNAIDYFNLKEILKYEPAAQESEKRAADCVLCIDVLEHIFISDLKNVIDDLYKHAKKLILIQVACYEAKAKLPNGENAHITVRNPMWWKGFVDAVSSNYYSASTVLMCSNTYKDVTVFQTWGPKIWNQSPTYTVNI